MRLRWLSPILLALLVLSSVAQGVLLYLYGEPGHLLLAIAWPGSAACLLVLLGLAERDNAFTWAAVGVAFAGAIIGYAEGAYRELPGNLERLILALPVPVTVYAIGMAALRSAMISTRGRNLAVLAACLVAVLAATTLGEARPPANRFGRDMSLRLLHAGCYEVTMGRWIPNWQPGHSISAVNGRYRLDTTAGQAVRGQRTTTNEASQALIRPGWFPGAAYWIPVDSNTIRLVWNTGFNGTQAILHRSPDGYRGRAYSHTDVVIGAPEPRTRAAARRIDCSLVPPDTVRAPGARESWWAERMRIFDSVSAAKRRRR